MKHINARLTDKQFSNLIELLWEAKDRAKDSILTCQLELEEVKELEEALF
tara:strand:- start:159 stop:308 length:150 start_codon:yes stop_codon:yes gene_type:complete